MKEYAFIPGGVLSSKLLLDSIYHSLPDQLTDDVSSCSIGTRTSSDTTVLEAIAASEEEPSRAAEATSWSAISKSERLEHSADHDSFRNCRNSDQSEQVHVRATSAPLKRSRHSGNLAHLDLAASLGLSEPSVDFTLRWDPQRLRPSFEWPQEAGAESAVRVEHDHAEETDDGYSVVDALPPKRHRKPSASPSDMLWGMPRASSSPALMSVAAWPAAAGAFASGPRRTTTTGLAALLLQHQSKDKRPIPPTEQDTGMTSSSKRNTTDDFGDR